MTQLVKVIVIGVVFGVGTLIIASLIAPVFGREVPATAVVQRVLGRIRIGVRGRPVPNVGLPTRGQTPVTWVSDLGLGNVEAVPVTEEVSGSIKNGLEVLANLQTDIPQLQAVYRVLTDNSQQISFRRLRRGLGLYESVSRMILIDTAIEQESNFVMAVILAHEGQHALDHKLGRLGRDPRSCFNTEARAFDLTIFVWQSIWGMDGLLNDPSRIEQTFNQMARIRTGDPLGYVDRLISLYGDACG